MAQAFRLAVLECDTPFPAVKKIHGSYAEIFRKLLTKGLQGLGTDVQLDLTLWDVVEAQEYPSVDDVDGFLLTGSKHSAFEDDPWIVKLVDFVKEVHTKTSKPVVGICFGHQIVGRALGANVGVNPGGWEISVVEVPFNEEGQKVFGVSSLELHQMHRDAVLEVPEGVVNLGSSPACKVQGLYEPGRILTLQSHPEFDPSIMIEILESRHKAKMFDDEMFNDGMKRAQRPHGGTLVSTKIWKFLLDSKAEEMY
ncbi:Fc.00g043300.m01.CDS01 [Cosmosporella sp. VM-42]